MTGPLCPSGDLESDSRRHVNPQSCDSTFSSNALDRQFGLPLCDSAHLKAMTDGELHAYFYNLDDRIKRHVMSLDPRIAQRWKLPDDMEAY